MEIYNFCANMALYALFLIANCATAFPSDYNVSGQTNIRNGGIGHILNGDDSLTVTSSGSITISGQSGSNRHAIYATGNPVNGIVNRIQSSGRLDTYDSYGSAIYLRGANYARVENTVSGEIETHSFASSGIYAREMSHAVLANYGSITTVGDSSHGITARGWIRSKTLNRNIHLINGGTIDLARRGSVGLRNAYTIDSLISNLQSGRINTNGDFGYGIYNSFADRNVIDNAGFINTTGDRASGLRNSSSDDVSISNSGSVVTSGDRAHGIFSSNSMDVAIRNTGLVETRHASAQGFRSEQSRGMTSFWNSGRVYSDILNNGHAIDFSSTDRDSILTLVSGTRIIGRMDLGGGDDQDHITLDRTQRDIAWRWTFENFSELTEGDILTLIGDSYVIERGTSRELDYLRNFSQTAVEGATITVVDLSREATASGVLMDVTDSIHGAVTGRISQAWSYVDAGQPEDRDEDGDQEQAELAAPAAEPSESDDQSGSEDDTWQVWGKVFGGMRERDEREAFAAYDHVWAAVCSALIRGGKITA